MQNVSTLTEILEHNRKFVDSGTYRDFETTKYPDKKLVVLTCMDTRLVELVPRAMNIYNGDAKMVRSVGAVISHPFDSVMRSILLVIYELNAREVCVVGHHDCGMTGLRADATLERARELGVPAEKIDTLIRGGIDLEGWLTGFTNVEESVKESVQLLKQHPLLPPGIAVHGLVIHPETGKLDIAVNGDSSY